MMQKMQRAVLETADKRRTRHFGGRGGLSLRVAGAGVAKQPIEDIGGAAVLVSAAGQTSFGETLVASQVQTGGVEIRAQFNGSRQSPIRSGERIGHAHASQKDASHSSMALMSHVTVGQSVIPWPAPLMTIPALSTGARGAISDKLAEQDVSRSNAADVDYANGANVAWEPEGVSVSDNKQDEPPFSFAAVQDFGEAVEPLERPISSKAVQKLLLGSNKRSGDSDGTEVQMTATPECGVKTEQVGTDTPRVSVSAAKLGDLIRSNLFQTDSGDAGSFAAVRESLHNVDAAERVAVAARPSGPTNIHEAKPKQAVASAVNKETSADLPNDATESQKSIVDPYRRSPGDVRKILLSKEVPLSGTPPSPSGSSSASTSKDISQDSFEFGASWDNKNPKLPNPSPDVPLNNGPLAPVLRDALRGELRVGVQTETFGRVTIQTNIAGGQLAAQLSIENTKQSAAIANHLPVTEQRIAERYGLDASILLTSSGGANTSMRDSSADSNQGQLDRRRSNSARVSSRIRGGMSITRTAGIESAIKTRSAVSASTLDVIV